MTTIRRAIFPALSSVIFSLCAVQNASASSDLALLNSWTSNPAGLSDGQYMFGQLHSKLEAGFSDQWSFSLAKNGDASVNLSEISLEKMSSLFGLKQLALSATDNAGNNLGSIGANGTLHLGTLAAGIPYKITVSGEASGFLGGAYFGQLSVDSPTPVPIGDSLPFFASALVVLGWKLKAKTKAIAGATKTAPYLAVTG